MHEAVYQISVFFMILFIVVFAFVTLGSKKSKDYEPIQKKGLRIRKYWFFVLVLILLIVSGFTLRELPYGIPADKTEPDIVVDAVAKQFVFELSEKEFKVGQTVQFNVTSGDVNHGFGLYDPDTKLVAQTQAMPDYTNTIYYTFDTPGTYQILCLEYCGLAHHIMISEITVTE